MPLPLNGVVNVKDTPYSATGDGTTNDYAAIAAAIAACSAAGGGTVLFPAGTYKINSSLVIPSSIRLVGAGKNATTLKKGANITLLDFSGTSNAARCQRGGAADMRLHGDAYTGYLIRCKWSDHHNFDRLYCYYSADTAAYLENCWDTYFNEVEFDTCSGSNGFRPSVLITSNADDSSNIIDFTNCRWEAFIDGALWIAARAPSTAYVMPTGTNPPYGVKLTGCKMETPQAKGSIISTSADFEGLYIDGLYMAARGVYAGEVASKVLFEVPMANDLSIQRTRIRLSGGTPATAYCVFYFYSNANISIRDVTLDCVQNPDLAVFFFAGGAPDVEIENVTAKPGQTPTMISGTWPPQVASATTLTIPKNPPLVVVTGTTNVTSMTAQLPGRRVVLRFTGALTFTDGSNLKLAGNLVTAANTTLDLVCDGTDWHEAGRSANA